MSIPKNQDWDLHGITKIVAYQSIVSEKQTMEDVGFYTNQKHQNDLGGVVIFQNDSRLATHNAKPKFIKLLPNYQTKKKRQSCS